MRYTFYTEGLTDLILILSKNPDTITQIQIVV